VGPSRPPSAKCTNAVRRRYPAIPVLVVSGYAAQLIKRIGVLKPPAVFVNKPYHMAEILKALHLMTERL